jgi:hypothetical protein
VYKNTTTTATTVAEKPMPHLQPNCKGNDFFRPVGHKHIANQLDLPIVKLFCAGGIAPWIADFQEWKDIFHIVIPRYVPASWTRLMDDHIMSKQERVQQLQLANLRTRHHLTLSLDGGEVSE